MLASTDYLDVTRRLRALSSISNKLNQLGTEKQLCCEVVDLLHLYFDVAQFIEVVIVDRAHELSNMYSRERGRELKTLECGGVDALPMDRRADFSVPRILPAEALHGPMMSVPLMAGTTLLGLLVVEAVAGGRFSQADLDAVAGVAGQVSLSIQHLRVTRRMEEQRHLEKDMQAAKRIQRSLLPKLPPTVNGFRVAAEYRPAFDVGGDFYDVVSSKPGKVTALIGDVSGKGVSGALVMSRVATEIHKLAQSDLAPKDLLHSLNESFAAKGCEDAFVTAACVELDSRRRLMTIANAGHVLPLVRRASGGVFPVGGASGPPIGMLPDQCYRNESFPLDAGDIVLLMTDGVLEALHKEGDQLGMSAILEIVGKAPRNINEINSRILDAVDRATRGALTDDITLLALEVKSRAS